MQTQGSPQTGPVDGPIPELSMTGGEPLPPLYGQAPASANEPIPELSMTGGQPLPPLYPNGGVNYGGHDRADSLERTFESTTAAKAGVDLGETAVPVEVGLNTDGNMPKDSGYLGTLNLHDDTPTTTPKEYSPETTTTTPPPPPTTTTPPPTTTTTTPPPTTTTPKEMDILHDSDMFGGDASAVPPSQQPEGHRDFIGRQDIPGRE